ncbi:MAG: YcjF family protein [Eggerthellaceae bacterium]|jgi:uncharacterized protein (DUF697 family)
MQIPVNIKAVIDEATKINEALETPIAVSVYIDDTAPNDIIAHVRSAFASASARVRMTISYLDEKGIDPNPDSDIAIIVAGLSQQVGASAAEIRGVGVPTMVVTTLPQLVSEIAESEECPIPYGDIVAPAAVAPLQYHSLMAQIKEVLPGVPSAKSYEPVEEPCALDEDAKASLNWRMSAWIGEICRRKRLAFALAFPFMRKALSLDIVNATSMQNAGIGAFLFIPGADMPIMTLNQAKMLLQIAAVYGQPMNNERIKELIALVSGGFACRGVARQLVAIIPAAGILIKAGVGYSGTLAMGRTAIEYFEAGGNAMGLAHVATKAANATIKVIGTGADFVNRQSEAWQKIQGSSAATNETKENLPGLKPSALLSSGMKHIAQSAEARQRTQE